MDTNNLLNIIKMFGNNTNIQNQAQNNNSNIMSPEASKISKMYPYGDFPYRYTKSMQEEMKSALKSGKNISTLGIENNEQAKPDAPPQQNPANNFNMDNIKQLLPLMSNIQNNDKMGLFDMFNLLVPSIKSNSGNLKEIIKSFSNTKKNNCKKNTLPESKMQSIDTYKKVD